ncbi:OmpA family protein [Spirosoma foliorum]|uniref:OmpA family protein n=1 Tax=Spirosoma foliorum TaxID=2710596 RepID=A0A7G5GXM9_9BACT|nr:OmpA family protein [Spirosoma foliorum]QMW03621.1 OmpA family protein [Spirosoma foliorum]
MRMLLIIRLLLCFYAWQWIGGSYSFGQDPKMRSAGRAIANANAAELPLSIYILYFDQSSPKLRPGVKVTLDSIAQQLAGQPAWIATVTGYTDNVGKRELNLVLAERRSKTVADYLKQRGVHPDQIIVKWEEPELKASAENQEDTKTISRRVAVQLSPK